MRIFAKMARKIMSIPLTLLLFASNLVEVTRANDDDAVDYNPEYEPQEPESVKKTTNSIVIFS